jgi:hypothetical protein
MVYEFCDQRSAHSSCGKCEKSNENAIKFLVLEL